MRVDAQLIESAKLEMPRNDQPIEQRLDAVENVLDIVLRALTPDPDDAEKADPEPDCETCGGTGWAPLRDVPAQIVCPDCVAGRTQPAQDTWGDDGEWRIEYAIPKWELWYSDSNHDSKAATLTAYGEGNSYDIARTLNRAPKLEAVAEAAQAHMKAMHNKGVALDVECGGNELCRAIDALNAEDES